MKQFCILILFSISFAIASAISCYDCDSMRNPHCNQYFNPEGVQKTDCDEAEMPEYLRKYERRLPATGCLTKVHEGVDGYQFFIRRSCYFGDLEKTDEACAARDEYVFFADLISCHVCDEDLCNNTNAGQLRFLSKTAAVLSFLCCLFVYKSLKI